MSRQQYTPEFKDEDVRQVTERGHSVQEVAARLGVSSHSLYKWVKAVRPEKNEQRGDELLDAKKEILKLRAELRRVQEERDIVKKAVVFSVPCDLGASARELTKPANKLYMKRFLMTLKLLWR